MGNCLLIWNIFLALFQIIYCLTKGDKGVCFDIDSSEYYCCAHFEKKHGICVECENGLFSIQSQPCKPCENNRFGYKCLSTCTCNVSQRCDNIEGCVDMNVNSEKYVKTEYTPNGESSSATTELYGSILFKDEQTGLASEMTGSTTSQPLNVADNELDRNGISKTHLMIYSGAITGVVLILCACNLYFRFRTRVRNKTVLYRDVELREQIFDNTSELVEVIEGIYHTIDESNINDFTENANSYLEVVISSESSDTSLSSTSMIDETKSGYLHPYNSLLVTTEIHVYEKTHSANETRIEMSVTNEDDVSENEEYSQSRSSHKTDESSSGRESEKSNSNGYLYPQIDRDDVYDLSVLRSRLNAETES